MSEADENKIVALNYSTRYREWWAEYRNEFDPIRAAEVVYGYELADKLLARAQHFLLPPGGQVLHTSGLLHAKFAPLLHLPYPVTAFEFTWKPSPKGLGRGEVRSCRRIALCVDAATANAMRIASLESDEWLCISIYSIDDAHLWVVHPHVNVVSRSRVCKCTAELYESSRGLIDEIHALGLDKADPQLIAVGTEVLDLRTVEFPGAANWSAQSAYLDTRDEVIAAVEACASLGCKNVGTRIVHASSILNQSRTRKGKLPLLSYHVLDVTSDEGPRVIERGVGGGGTHASPRRHLRRGHIRWLSEERSVFVRATMVKGTSPGTVKKDYRFNT